jgi:dissimilatory sulfite reductase (desulfoviridin) alpha/beta subunit
VQPLFRAENEVIWLLREQCKRLGPLPTVTIYTAQKRAEAEPQRQRCMHCMHCCQMRAGFAAP